MIFSESILNIADNTGARIGRCIKVLTPVSSKGRKIAKVGDIIMVSIQRVLPDKKIKKGGKYRALILTTKQKIKRVLGTLSFNHNNAILLNKDNEPLGNRLTTIAVKEIREKKFAKVISLSLGII